MTSSRSEAPRGGFVVIVGPDGTGKTTLARALEAAYPGETRYFHFRPPLRRRLLDGVPTTGAAPPAEKMKPRRRGDRFKGWLRLCRSVLHCVVVYVLRIRPAVRRGSLVIGDRWIFGYLTQPTALRYYGPAWMARTLVAALPEPTLTVSLTAPVTVLLERKQELTADELARELVVTGQLPITRMMTLSSEESPDRMAAKVLQRLATIGQFDIAKSWNSRTLCPAGRGVATGLAAGQSCPCADGHVCPGGRN